MSRILSVFALLLLFTPLFGQDEKGSIALLCSPRPDSILLRWAPADRETWQLGNKYGYMVVRYTLLKGGELLEDIPQTTLTSEALKPAPIENWEKYVDDDKYAGIAAECIFFENTGNTGGNPHAVARRYREEQNRFGFALYAADQSVTAARLSGLYMADKTAQKDEKYLYRVFIPAPYMEIPVDTAYAFTGISEYQPLPPPLELTAEWADKKVDLSWNILYLSHHYNSYIVEKSTDGVSFAPVSENAVVQVSDEGVTPEYAYKTDTLDNNMTTYYYRVRGITAFGETGPPCEPVSGKGVLPITHGPVIENYQVVNNEQVRLSWSYPDEMNAYITGFRIYRSGSPNEAKERIYESSSSGERSFTDNNPSLTNYYVVSVFNEQKEVFLSDITYAELVDSIPPQLPSGLTGEIDTTGKVYVRWDRNPDKDIDGYRIYRANHRDFEYTLVYPAVLKDTFFVDSVNLRTLTRDVFYKVKAIDLRQNESPFSQTLALTRPDIIPPVSPVIRNAEGRDGGVAITWVNSSSADVAGHHIYRKDDKDTVYSLIAAFDKPEEITSVYTDRTVAKGRTYTYYMVARDESGLFSQPSNPVQLKIKSAISESIQLKKQEFLNSIQLSWNIVSEKPVAKTLIYRSVGDEPLRLYDHSMENSYTDHQLAPEKKYTYRIRAVYEDESTSGLSNVVVMDNGKWKINNDEQ